MASTNDVRSPAKEPHHFGEHPDVEIYLSQPGLGVVLGARVLAEFGDDKNRYADARARRNYAGTSPITRQSGKRKLVLARYVHNDRLVDALGSDPDRAGGAGCSLFAALRRSWDAQCHRQVLHHRVHSTRRDGQLCRDGRALHANTVYWDRKGDYLGKTYSSVFNGDGDYGVITIKGVTFHGRNGVATTEVGIISVNYSGRVVSGMIQTDVCAVGGDSGGPLISELIGGELRAWGLGVLSGGSGDCSSTSPRTYFNPLGEILDQYGLTLGPP